MNSKNDDGQVIKEHNDSKPILEQQGNNEKIISDIKNDEENNCPNNINPEEEENLLLSPNLKKENEKNIKENRLDNDDNDNQKQEGEKANFQCGLCNLVFEKSKDLQKHIRNLHEEKLDPNIVDCNYCGLSFPEKNMVTHMALTHRNIELAHENIYECDLCENKFSHNSNLKRHKRKVHNLILEAPQHEPKKTDVKCEICGKFLRHRSNLRKHIDAVHKGLKKFHCQICQLSVTSLMSLQRHLRRIHNVIDPKKSSTKSKNENCEICGELFENILYLQEHINLAHNDINVVYKCETCGDIFNSLEEQALHVQKSHKNEENSLENSNYEIKIEQPDEVSEKLANSQELSEIKQENNFEKPEYLVNNSTNDNGNFDENFEQDSEYHYSPGNVTKYDEDFDGKIEHFDNEYFDDNDYSIDNKNFNDDEQEEYIVEQILDKKISHYGGTVEYLIKWKGYSDQESTWEPKENIFCQNLIDDFENGINNTSQILLENNIKQEEGEQEIMEENHQEIPLLGENDFICKMCGKSLSGRNGLIRHMRLVHKVKKIQRKKVSYQCSLCSEVYQVEKELIQHIQMVHEGQNLYSCQSCNVTFRSEIQFKRHIETDKHKGEGEYKCDYMDCGKVFLTIKKLKTHKEGVHQRKHKVSCEICGKVWQQASKWHLDLHIKEVHEGQKIEREKAKCDVCGKIVSSIRSLRKHKKFVHEGACRVKCDQCGKILSDKNALASHIKYVHEGKCYQCDFIPPQAESDSTRSQLLKDHIDKNHRNVRCEIETCNEIFTTKQSMKSHIERIHNSKIYQCDKCDKSYSLSINLQNHIKFIHEEPNSFTCSTCGKSFDKAGYLRTHFKFNHEEGNEENCTYCNKLFKGKRSLQRHIQTRHEGKRTDPCYVCGKTFTAELTLKKHIEMVHDKLRPEVCEECGKAFARVQVLKLHIKTVHEKLKDIICETCGRAFTQKPDLKKHILAIHHGIKYAGKAKLREKDKYDLVNEELFKISNETVRQGPSVI